MDNLALAYDDAGRLKESLPLHEKALELKKAKLGLDDPSTLVTMASLAWTNQYSGRLSEALPLFEEALAQEGQTRT